MVQSIIESFEWSVESSRAAMPSEDETDQYSSELDEEAAILKTIAAFGYAEPVNASMFSQRSRRISRKFSVRSNGRRGSRSGRTRLIRCVSGDKRLSASRGVARCISLKSGSPTSEKMQMPRRVLSSNALACATQVQGHVLRRGSLSYSIPTTRLSLRRTSGCRSSRKALEMPCSA